MQLRVSLTEGAGIVMAWPALCARAYGFYEREGLTVEPVVLSEADATAALIAGTAPLARRAADPYLRSIESGAPIRVLAALLDAPPLALYARPEIGELAALRGESVAAMSAQGAGSMVLRMVLALGPVRDDEIALRDVGRAANRWTALRDGEVAAALLSPPASARAEAAGFRPLCRLAEAFPDYTYAALHANTAFVSAERAAVVAFLRAELLAAVWLYDPANRTAAVAELARFARLEPADAEACYDELVVRDRVFARDLVLDERRVAVLIDALQRFAGERPGWPPGAYLDPEPVREARRGLDLTEGKPSSHAQA